MRAGLNRHRITVLKPVEDGRDDHGVIKWSHTPDGDIWGEIRALTGNELLAAQQINAEVTSQVMVRFLDGKRIGPTYKLQLQAYGDYPGRILDVAAPPIDREGTRETLTILCTEPVPALADQLSG